jgi:hypothetical protein
MTRKDYVFLAAALKASRPPFPILGQRVREYEGWKQAVRGVSAALSEQSSKFDAAMFEHNAGVLTPESKKAQP